MSETQTWPKCKSMMHLHEEVGFKRKFRDGGRVLASIDMHFLD